MSLGVKKKQNKRHTSPSGDYPDISYGKNPVLEAINGPRKVYEVLFADNPKKWQQEPLFQLVKKEKIPHNFVPRTELDYLSHQGVHQGVLARLQNYPDYSLHEVFDKKESKLVLVLDSIQDPQNFGSLCRTALCFGIREIIIPKDHSAPTSGLVAKASAGAIEHLKIIRVTNLTRSIEELKKNEFWIYGTDLSKTATDITKINPGKKSAIVLGTEGKGIRRLVSEACDAHVRVPLQADFDSLNVAQAGAVLMYGFSQAMIE
jgi:23S rRNA (guanosine2251-2'-O)-methyltransferase